MSDLQIKKQSTLMNMEPLKSFFENEMLPADVAILFEKLLDDYIDLILKLQLMDDEIRLNVDTENFIHILRRLRDALREC